MKHPRQATELRGTARGFVGFGSQVCKRVSLRSGSLRAPNAASGLPDRSWHLLSRMVGRSCLRVAEAGHAGDSGAASAEEHEKAQEGLLSDSGTHSCERVKGAGQAAGEVDGNAL